jgi:RNA polymerase sigma-70 factor (ECF subfamily)
MGKEAMDETAALGADARGIDSSSLASDRRAAIEELYEAHRLAVYRYLRSLSASDADAADLTATTFEHALRAIDRLRPDGSAVAWLLRIARNAAIDDRRRSRPVSTLETVREAEHPTAETPEASYLEAERVEELRRLVRRLPEAQREAIALRYAAGLSAREIGEVIGKSAAASQKLIERALVALREAQRVER